MSYSPEWFEGKTADEVKALLADRHGIPLWRVEEIIEVWKMHRPEWEGVLEAIKSTR